MGINPGNPSIARAVANLREDASRSKEAVRLYLETQLADLRSGRFLERFFAELDANPIAQRLLLVRALKSAFLTPAANEEGGETDADYAFLQQAGAPVDFDGDLVRGEVDKRNQELSGSAQPGLLSRLTDRDNSAFQAAKRKAVTLLEGLEADVRDELKRGFWRAFEGELRKVAETVLQSFRRVAEISDEAARQAVAEAERFRKDPASQPDSEIAQNYLDAEVLRDDRRKERLWHLLYTHLLDKDAWLDPKDMFRTVTEAFKPARDPDGRLRARDASEIVRVVKEHLLSRAGEVYGRALEEVGMDLARGLELEQRYIALLDAGESFDALRARAALDDAIRAVSPVVIRKGIEDRLVRVQRECVILAHVDATRRDDPTVTPADVFYVGLHERFDTGEADSLGALLRGVSPGLNLVPDWTERDSLVMYRAQLGLPLYWFRNVGTVLEPAYRRVRDDPNRSYPLHIEASWERDPGLPDLDPVQVKAAEVRRKAEEAARAESDKQRNRLRAWLLAELAGGVVSGPDGLSWSLSGAAGPLGASRAEAHRAFLALDATLRGLIEQGGVDHFARAMADARSRPALAEALAAQLNRLTGAFAAAVASRNEAEHRHVAEERGVIEALQAEVRAAG
jgi:hypothetical protein